MRNRNLEEPSTTACRSVAVWGQVPSTTVSHYSRGTSERDIARWQGPSRANLVLAGLTEDWAETPAGKVVTEVVRTEREPTAPGHPEDPCRG